MNKFARAPHHLLPSVGTFEHQDHCNKAERERNLGDRGAYGRYQRIDFEAASRLSTPLASRSSCTVFSHQPTFAPPGHRSVGRIGVTCLVISAAVRPGASVGVTLIMAFLMASFFSA